MPEQEMKDGLPVLDADAANAVSEPSIPVSTRIAAIKSGALGLEPDAIVSVAGNMVMGSMSLQARLNQMAQLATELDEAIDVLEAENAEKDEEIAVLKEQLGMSPPPSPQPDLTPEPDSRVRGGSYRTINGRRVEEV